MKLTLYPVLLGLALVSVPSLGAEEAADPPPLSPSCRAPIQNIAAPAPLPHLTAALRSERRIRVMAIGSSSTVGVGASSPAKTYPAQLETILERTFKTLDVVVLNRGVSGELATATAERLQREIPLDQPDIVLWQVGTNDALAKVPAEAFKATVQSTVQWLKEHRIDTVLVGLQYSPRVAQDEHHTATVRMHWLAVPGRPDPHSDRPTRVVGAAGHLGAV